MNESAANYQRSANRALIAAGLVAALLIALAGLSLFWLTGRIS